MHLSRNLGIVTAPMLAGVERLPAALTINGSTETPVFRYNGGDATTSAWLAWTYGEDLSIAGAGADVTPNQGSPFLGGDSVLFNGGKHYQASGNSFADVTTEDIVCELVIKATATAAYPMGKFNGAQGYCVICSGTKAIFQVAVSGVVSVLSATLTENAWYHILFFLDRSGFGQCYVNGTASGSAVNISAKSGSATVAAPLRVGGIGANLYDSNIAYLAVWKKDAWLDTHLQADIATERASLWLGHQALHNHGALTPSTL